MLAHYTPDRGAIEAVLERLTATADGNGGRVKVLVAGRWITGHFIRDRVRWDERVTDGVREYRAKVMVNNEFQGVPEVRNILEIRQVEPPEPN